LCKRKRNMIVEVDGDLPLYDGFCWLTLDQVRQLLRVDNLVNMDARSVLSCFGFLDRDEFGPSREERRELRDAFDRALFDSMATERGARHTVNELVGWLTEMKMRYELHVKRIPLDQVSGWVRTESKIAHQSGRYFSVIAVAVHAENREVLAWTQPLLKSTRLGLIGFLVQKQNGLLHFAVQAKVEPGNLDVVDLAPTVSCSDAELVALQPYRPPFFDLLYHAAPRHCRYSAIQSEEGGRFYHFQNRYMVLELDPADRLALPDNYVWMTGGQMRAFMRHGALNIEARNLLACLGC
jgi:oxidase EvaA